MDLLQNSSVISQEDKEYFKMTMPTFDGIEQIDLKKYGRSYKIKENNRHLQILKQIA